MVESTALEMRRTCKGIGFDLFLSAILLRAVLNGLRSRRGSAAAPSHACSCQCWAKARYIDEAFTVFEGRVMSTRPVSPSDGAPLLLGGGPTEQVTSFKVLNRIKGEVANDVEVFSIKSESMCGFDFERHVGRTVAIGTYKQTAPRSVTELLLDHLPE